MKALAIVVVVFLSVLATCVRAETVKSGGYTFKLLNVKPRAQIYTSNEAYSERYVRYTPREVLYLDLSGRIIGGEQADLRLDVYVREKRSGQEMRLEAYVTIDGKSNSAVIEHSQEMGIVRGSKGWTRTSWLDTELVVTRVDVTPGVRKK